VAHAAAYVTELLGDLLHTEPRESDGLENVIVVDKIPQVGSDRIEKLRAVLTKLFSKAGEIVKEHYPLDENGHTLG
jgi:translation initiation factor 3 subunit B